MQPPPLHPPSSLPIAVSVWAMSMVVLGLAVGLHQPALLMLMALAALPIYFFAQRLPPPRAAVRALEAAGMRVGFDDGVVRCVEFKGRRVRLFTPRAGRREGTFLVAISHALPLADHTWVAWSRGQHASRHAPWDLRTRILQALDAAPPAVSRITLTDEHFEFVLPRNAASALTRRLEDCEAFTERLEVAFVQDIVNSLVDAGFDLDAVTFGSAGEIGFDARVADRQIVVRFGRYRDGQPHWRGRPELQLTPVDAATETLTIIGPCTRNLVVDLQSLRRRLR